MAKKKSGYAPKKISLPTIRRSAIQLAKIEDTKHFTAAYCWFGKNDGGPIPGIEPGDPFFVFDLCSGKNKTVSVYLDFKHMRDVVDRCRHLSSLSLLELAQQILLDNIMETDPRYKIWSTALWGLDISPISDTVSASNLDEYVFFLVQKIISYGCIEFDAEKLEETKAILSALIAGLYHTEIDIKRGDHFIPVTYVHYDSENLVAEPGTNILRQPMHTLRIGYKCYLDGIDFRSWQLLAQCEYFRQTEDKYIDTRDGRRVNIGPDFLDTTRDPEIKVTVTDKDFLRLLDQIEYRLAHA